MTAKELRELDAWIAEYVMGCRLVDMLRDLKDFTFLKSDDSGVLLLMPGSKKLISFSPTTDPADAMMVLEKCVEFTSLAISNGTTGFMISDMDKKSRWEIQDSLPLAICLFAKKLFLFSKTT